MSRLVRGSFIVVIVLRYGLDELVLTSFQKPWLRVLARILSVGRDLQAPRGQRIREALERLGPIFVKFGQVLSTRRDLLPNDIADELAKLPITQSVDAIIQLAPNTTRTDPRYAGRSWDEVESEAQRDWTTRYPDRPWDRTKAAVRHAWDRMTE